VTEGISDGRQNALWKIRFGASSERGVMPGSIDFLAALTNVLRKHQEPLVITRDVHHGVTWDWAGDHTND